MVFNYDSEVIYLENQDALLNVEIPLPVGRYKTWLIRIYTRPDQTGQVNQYSLDIIENLVKNCFPRYKIFREKLLYYNQSDLKDRSNLEPISLDCWYIVVVTKTRVRISTLFHIFIDSFFKQFDIDDLNDYLNSFNDSITLFRCFDSYEKTNLESPVLASSEPSAREYLGKDISVLDKMENRYPWQNEVLKMFLDVTTGEIIEAPQRQINYIYDPLGNTGKSLFVKWICVNYPDDTMKFTYSTPTQLRTGIIAEGVKRVYFIDLPRTKSQFDSGDAILSVIEDLKAGHLISLMYGKSQKLVMDPPHVFIFCNIPCPIEKLSSDRWFIRTIDNTKYKLVNYIKSEAEENDKISTIPEFEFYFQIFVLF